MHKISWLNVTCSPLLLLLFFSGIAAGNNAPECNCDHVVGPQRGPVNGETLGVLPGDVICIDGDQEYNSMVWTNIVGTESDPIIIKNCGGQVHINPSVSSYGWKFERSKHFKILGNGDPKFKYGIKVTTRTGFYLTFEVFTTNFEVAHLEIAGAAPNGIGDGNGFAGIGVKTSPYQGCDIFTDPTRTAWVMDEIKIHTNYIHDVGGEGLYVGHGFYNGRKESACDERTYSHAIKNLEIYDNIIENVGFDGMQIKNADENALIHGNIIRNYGTRNHGAHNEGLFIGDATEALVYSNWVENGSGHGIQINGFGESEYFNNVIINSGVDGIYLNNNNPSFANKDGVFKIYNNTFINMGDEGFEAYTPQKIELKNNIFVNNIGSDTRGSKPVSETNIFTKDINDIGFVNHANLDFRLQNNSIARDAGSNVALQYDYSGFKRKDNRIDVGAFEFRTNDTKPEPKPKPKSEDFFYVVPMPNGKSVTLPLD